MIRKFFAGFLLILFVVLSIPFAFAATALSLFLSRDFYTGNFSDQLYEYVAVSISEKSSDVKLPISGDDAEGIFRKEVSTNDVRDFVSALWDEIAELEVDDSGATIVKLPVNLISEKGEKFATAMADKMMADLPKCEKDQNLPEDFSCLPETLAKDDLILLLERTLDQKIFSSIPDQFVLSTNLPKNFNGGIVEYLGRVINVALLAFLLIFLLILFVMGLLVFRPLSRILKWISAAVFFSSFVNSIIFIVLFVATPFLIPDFEFAGFSTLIVFSLAKNLLIFSIPLLLISMPLWIYFIYYDSRRVA